MAVDTFELEIATPERLLVKERAASAQIPCEGGEIGVLPGHAPLLSSLGIGTLTFLSEGKYHRVAIAGGVVEVLPELVRVLTLTAEKPEDIDSSRARAALKRATDRLDSVKENMDSARALNAMMRARARLQALGEKVE